MGRTKTWGKKKLLVSKMPRMKPKTWNDKENKARVQQWLTCKIPIFQILRLLLLKVIQQITVVVLLLAVKMVMNPVTMTKQMVNLDMEEDMEEDMDMVMDMGLLKVIPQMVLEDCSRTKRSILKDRSRIGFL